MPTETGIYTAYDAVEGHKFSPKLCNSIAGLLDKNIPVIDLGCGEGVYVNELIKNGFTAYGVDGLPLPMHNENITIFDLSRPFAAPIKGNVICLEVGEHIPADYEEILINNITENCLDTVVLSWAVEGQMGIGHVNCRNNDYIIQKMKEKFFQYCDEETLRFRSNIEDQCEYFRNTVMIFKRVK